MSDQIQTTNSDRALPVRQFTERDALRALFIQAAKFDICRGRTRLRCRFLDNSVPKKILALLGSGGKDLLRSKLGAQDVIITEVPEGTRVWWEFEILFIEAKQEIRRSRRIFAKTKSRRS